MITLDHFLHTFPAKLQSMDSIFLLLAVILLAGTFLATTAVLTVLGALLFLILIFVVHFLFIYFRELRSRDHRPPVAGPMFNQLIHFSKMFDYQTSLSQKYSTFRLILPSHSEIYTIDPANIEYFLKTNFPNYGKGQYNIDVMGDLFGDGIFAVDGDKWRHQRKLASYEFSTKVLREFSTSVFRRSGARLVSEVFLIVGAKQVIDLQDMLMKSTLDSIFKVGFGFEVNTLSGSDEFGNRFTKSFDESNSLVFWRYVDPLWKFKRFLSIGSEGSLKKNIKIIDDSIYQLIRFKRDQIKEAKTNVEKEDILSRFLMESEKDPENMTDKYLRDITLNFLIAGRDTSANTLTWFFYMLCKYPVIQERVSQDVKMATEFNEGVVSVEEFTELISEDALDKMQYLHAALTETLRLYPAVPVDGKNAAEDDVLPDGFKVKKGDGINYMPYAMGRMTCIWGDDAEIFRPERWLHNGVYQPESPFKFTAFQAGPRICLGKEFAYRQMEILAALLLKFFRFKLADETKEATYRTMFTLHMDQGLHVYALPR